MFPLDSTALRVMNYFTEIKHVYFIPLWRSDAEPGGSDFSAGSSFLSLGDPRNPQLFWEAEHAPRK